ncbi:hypothetical protein JCM14469_18070 [Desulfatiferula olefinivorans]
MSEFLKNFRSTHSRYAGNKRNPYDGHYYPSQERRTGNDRRNESGSSSGKPSASLFAKLEEFLPRLLTLLETITENQQQLIEMKDRESRNADMMASAFKDIGAVLDALRSRGPGPVIRETRSDSSETNPPMSIKELDQTEMKSSADEKREVIRIMKKLRKKGGTYKEIAHFLNENKIPTFSNKGYWHAQTIHRLCSRS